jgi:hypothetical protein
MTQAVEHLPSKCRVLKFKPQYCQKTKTNKNILRGYLSAKKATIFENSRNCKSIP